MYFQKEKNVLPVQRLSEQLMCGVACQLKLVCGGGFGSTGQEWFLWCIYGCSQPSRFATGSPMGLSVPWHRGYALGYWVCNKILGMHQCMHGCRVSEGQHCGKCTLPLFLISAPGKKDQRVGGWDVLARSCISTPILIWRNMKMKKNPKQNMVSESLIGNCIWESIVAGETPPPASSPHYIWIN